MNQDLPQAEVNIVDPFMIGKTILHYEILEKLGRGGMGIVYKAQDTKLDRVLALKFLPQDMSADNDAKQRFIQEAKAASALDHPNICTIHDIGETENGELYIVMAYYEGQTLGYRLEEEKFSIERSVDIITNLARALERAHEAGIIHRDIKPANIMVSDRGEVKLLDFGLAKLTSGRLDLTKEGSTLGTAAYMSPEQAQSEDVDEGSDIWAVGVVLYEILAGRKPFESAYEQALLYSILNEEPVPIKEVRPDVPENLAVVVARCLTKDRSARFATMSDLLLALDAGGVTVDTPSESVPVTGIRVSKRTIVGGIVGLVFIIVLVALFQLGGSDSDIPISENRVAILPFSVRGSAALDYLGEGMVDLMSEKLNGAGDIQTVNPRIVIALLKNEDLDSTLPEEGNEAALLMGAGRYVTGEVLQVGDLMRLTAYVNETNNITEPISSGTFEGTESDLLGALDGLAAELLSGMISGPAAEIQRAATSSSSSLEAVKVYLSGEKALREGRNREAAAAYRRAVELDSSFALAHYRTSIAAEWIDAPYVRSAADKAMEFADRLSPRERSLLTALQIRRHGWTAQSEQAYRIHLGHYLDDIEALNQLGEIHFHENPRQGRSTLESRDQFERVLELEPGNLIAQIHLARLDGLKGDLEALRERAEFFRQKAPDSERAVEVDAIIAYATGDLLGQQRVLDRLGESAYYFTFYVVHGVVRYARKVHGAATVLENRVSDDALVLFFLPQVSVMKGQFGAYNEFMRSGKFQTNPNWDLFEAFVATSGVIPIDKPRLRHLLERLENADLQETRNTGFVFPHDDITDEFLAFENAYHRGLILVQLGRLDEAVNLLNHMKSSEDFPGLGSIRKDILLSLEAEIALRKEDPEEALALLRQIRYEIPHAASVRSVADGSRSRYLRAELEYKIGNRNTTRDFYLGLDESWSPFDSFYRGPIYLRLAEIADSEGRIDDAILNYERLLEMWRDSDPELIPIRKSAEERLLDLQRRKTAEPGEVSSPVS